MVAKLVVVSDDICTIDGRVNPNAELFNEVKAQLPGELEPHVRPQLIEGNSTYYRWLFEEARRLSQAKDPRPHNMIVQDLIQTVTYDDFLRQTQEKKMANRATPRPQAGAPRRQATVPAKPAPTKPRPKPAVAMKTPVEAYLDEDGDEDLPYEAPEPAKLQMRSGLAKLSQVIAARRERTPQVDLSTLLKIEELSATAIEPKYTVTIAGEGTFDPFQIGVHWLEANETMVVLILDTRDTESDVTLPIEEIAEAGRLFLSIEAADGESLDLTTIADIVSFDWGVFRFLLFLLAD